MCIVVYLKEVESGMVEGLNKNILFNLKLKINIFVLIP